MAAVMAKADKPDAKQPRPERARGGEARRIADLVASIGDTSFKKFGFVQSSVITRWPEIVGAKLARVCSPESLRFPRGQKNNGVLHISVVGAHALVVQHVLPEIIARVNQFFGYAAVARIQLQQGKVAAVAPTVAVAPKLPPAAPNLPISADLNAIADPELRAVLEGLAGSLSRGSPLPKVS
jgi:hypothetical protein